MANFEEAVKKVIDHEGGYVNDPPVVTAAIADIEAQG